MVHDIRLFSDSRNYWLLNFAKISNENLHVAYRKVKWERECKQVQYVLIETHISPKTAMTTFCPGLYKDI